MRPAILILEEVDSISGSREKDQNRHSEFINTTNTLLELMDTYPHVFVVGTSNRPAGYFDPAVVRPGRLGHPVTVPLPDDEDRFEIMKLYMQEKESPGLTKLVRIPDCVSPLIKYADLLKVPQTNGLRNWQHNWRLRFWKDVIEKSAGFSGDDLRAVFNNSHKNAATDSQRLNVQVPETGAYLMASLENLCPKVHESLADLGLVVGPDGKVLPINSQIPSSAITQPVNAGLPVQSPGAPSVANPVAAPQRVQQTVPLRTPIPKGYERFECQGE